jgi:DNA-binding NarL/FixJ family response regulator
MPVSKSSQPRRVLIASGHALFGHGLRSLLLEHGTSQIEIVGMVSSLDEALPAVDALKPDLVIVDYDDQKLNRENLLALFGEGDAKLRLVLLSLHSPEDAVVYDRRTMAAMPVDTWLEDSSFGGERK